MRLAVCTDGYRSATRSLVSGNHVAARVCRELCDRLQGYAGMAGDDATATDFAASYDEAAAESVAALGELVAGFGSLAHLAEASLANHGRAEEDSVLPGWAAAVTGPPSLADRCVGVVAATSPSSLGGDPPQLPGAVNWVLDRIEGVVWPDADTDRLRDAADAWRTAGGWIRTTAADCCSARAAFEQEVSPEIPLAVATTLDLEHHVLALADQLDVLGDACTAYADQVDAKREEMLDLLTGLAIELGVGAIVSGVLTLVSAGLAAPAAAGAAAGRLAWAARELKLIVDALRLLTGGTAARLRPVTEVARDARGFLSRLRAARVGARTERGSVRLLPERDPWRPGWLASHEHSGSHTLERHVGKTDEELRERLAARKNLEFSSSFTDQPTAEKTLAVALRRHHPAIDEWLDGTSGRLVLQDSASFDVGRTAVRSGDVLDVTGLRMVLSKDPSMPHGYRIVTAFPEP